MKELVYICKFLSVSFPDLLFLDYYQALGLTPSATLEELKASYLNLARLHHPDTAPTDGKSAKDLEAEFVKISNAWGILSKPELKSQYDSLRSIYLARTMGFSHGIPSSTNADSSAISEGFNTQRINYATKVQSRASSNWMDLQDKYKTEKWQNLTLDQRKVAIMNLST